MHAHFASTAVLGSGYYVASLLYSFCNKTTNIPIFGIPDSLCFIGYEMDEVEREILNFDVKVRTARLHVMAALKANLHSFAYQHVTRGSQ